MNEEIVEYCSHPAMFRNRPVLFLLICLFPAGLGALNAQDSGAVSGVLMAMVSFVMLALPLLIAWKIATLCSTLTVTSTRSIHRRGLLSKRTSEVFHRDVRNVVVDQGILQRIFGAGMVAIASAGHGGMEIVAKGMPNPSAIKAILDSHRN